jgi:hypothetical protein
MNGKKNIGRKILKNVKSKTWKHIIVIIKSIGYIIENISRIKEKNKRL